MNLDDIRAMGIVQARKFSVEELVKAVYEGLTDTTCVLDHDEKGNQVHRVDRSVDTYSGSLVELREIWWDYYATGELKTVTVDDGIGLKERLVVKYYKDGTQPTATRMVIGEPISAEMLVTMWPTPPEEPQVPEEVVVEPTPEPVELPPVEVPVVEAVRMAPPEELIEAISVKAAELAVPPTRWQAFKKRVERAVFLLPKEEL